MMNYEKFNYHNYEAPNIFGEFYKTPIAVPVSKVVSHAVLREPINVLAKKHPEWKFISTSHVATANPGSLVALTFKVYKGNEFLGSIRTDYRNEEMVVAIENARIRADRVRGNAVKTKDAKKVVSVVEKNFFALTVAELIAIASSSASVTVDKNAYETRRKYIDLMGRAPELSVLGRIATAIASDLDAHRDMLFSMGVTKDVLDILPLIHTAYVDAEALRIVRDQGGGSVVLIRDQDYVVTNANSVVSEASGIKVFSTDTLPPAFKRSLGMLKLLENNCYIASVGVRVDEYTFFVDGVV